MMTLTPLAKRALRINLAHSGVKSAKKGNHRTEHRPKEDEEDQLLEIRRQFFDPLSEKALERK